jgi:hypothetical protein
VSSAFPLIIADPLTTRTLSDELARAVRAVNRSNLSIYPIDTQGPVAPNASPSSTAHVSDGDIARDLDTPLNLRLTPEQRDEMLRDGFPMTRTVDRRPAATRLHVLVRDAPTGTAGSVVIAGR